MSGLINLKPIKCPYCQEEIEDDEYNEHMVLMHPAEIDNYKDVLDGGEYI